MNNKQKLHQIKLSLWAGRFQEQAASGLTVKAWCLENNVTIHTYNYWKHKLKLEYIASRLTVEHDIVPLAPELLQPTSLSQIDLSNSSALCQLHDSHELHKSHEQHTLCIIYGDISISVGSKYPVSFLWEIRFQN